MILIEIVSAQMYLTKRLRQWNSRQQIIIKQLKERN